MANTIKRKLRFTVDMTLSAQDDQEFWNKVQQIKRGLRLFKIEGGWASDIQGIDSALDQYVDVAMPAPVDDLPGVSLNDWDGTNHIKGKA